MPLYAWNSIGNPYTCHTTQEHDWSVQIQIFWPLALEVFQSLDFQTKQSFHTAHKLSDHDVVPARITQLHLFLLLIFLKSTEKQ